MSYALQSSSLPPKTLMERLMDSLHGRIRAIKDASDHCSHTDSDSEIDDPRNAERSSPLGWWGQSKGSLRKDIQDEEKEEKDVSTILSPKTLATQQLTSKVWVHSLSQILQAKF